MNAEQICRVLKVEKAGGAYYVAQRKVYPNFLQRMFGKRAPYWVYFSLKMDDAFRDWNLHENHAFEYEDYESVPKDRFEIFKDVAVAEWYCKEFVRRNATDVVVKIWSIED